MKTTRYFDLEVMKKRPYLKKSWCEEAVSNPDDKVLQEDGRIRYYYYVAELGKFLRVVTLDDGTLHNAFPDRDYQPKEKRQ